MVVALEVQQAIQVMLEIQVPMVPVALAVCLVIVEAWVRPAMMATAALVVMRAIRVMLEIQATTVLVVPEVQQAIQAIQAIQVDPALLGVAVVAAGVEAAEAQTFHLGLTLAAQDHFSLPITPALQAILARLAQVQATSAQAQVVPVDQEITVLVVPVHLARQVALDLLVPQALMELLELDALLATQATPERPEIRALLELEPMLAVQAIQALQELQPALEMQPLRAIQAVLDSMEMLVIVELEPE